MSTNILDLQRLPDVSTLNIGSVDDSDTDCKLCSFTCSVTAVEA